MSQNTKLKTMLHEPLLHFLVIGFTLFFIYNQINSNIIENDHKTINVSKIDIKTINDKFYKKFGEKASKKELQYGIDNLVKEKILYLEAMDRDLDKNDPTIRKHLALKMQFIFDDLSIIKKPNDLELNTFLQANSNKFMKNIKISFNQIVFTPKKDSPKEVENFLNKLKSKNKKDLSTVGKLINVDVKILKKAFGDKFVNKLFKLPTNSWQGPIKSKKSIHLIYIHSKEVKLPKLSEIKNSVMAEWYKEKQAEKNNIFYKELYKNYIINIAKDK